MSPFTPDELMKSLRWRYAAKRFDPTRKLTNKQIEALKTALQLSPSSYGLQPWRFFLVDDEATKRHFWEQSYKQPQIETCSHLFILAALKTLDETYIKRHFARVKALRPVDPDELDTYERRLIADVVHGARAQFVSEWAARQVYIALGFLLLAASTMGIDACPMEGIQPKGYDALLALENTPFQTLLACPVGYRDPHDPIGKMEKVRFLESDIIVPFSIP